MAFSFRAGTNWHHDFPKLARESGFYFNAHTTRVRVDWNRISSIDIDRVIRERDFQTVDENVNNVIDYYLESEYDVKILDPNFVKLFRLAQLSVEYLLYCKQYLDQSVVFLKEELNYKKEEIGKLQDSMKDLKERSKERKKDNQKELKEKSKDRGKENHKCPHCPKSFISASYVNDHLLRKHSNVSDVFSSLSPAHEEYCAKTEKLENEIKTIKEQLNQSERYNPIKNEVSKMTENVIRDKILQSFAEGDSFQDDQYRRYQEEISNLKSMLFAEFRDIKRKESNANQLENEATHESIKELVNQQEKEIQRLKNQLQDHLSTNINEVQGKLVEQENYWKSKIEHLENQHRNDIENLFKQLKLTQESAVQMKTEYEEKVNFLEKQSMDQSKLLSFQTEQLHNITKGMLDSQSKKTLQKDVEIQNVIKEKTENLTDHSTESESSQSIKKPSKKEMFLSKHSPRILKSSQSYNKLISTKKSDDSQKVKSRVEVAKESNHSLFKEKNPEKNHRKTTKNGNKYSSLEESEKSDTSSVTETESESEEDSEDESSESSTTRTESTNDEPSEDETRPTKKDIQQKRRSSTTSTVSLETIKQGLQNSFDNKLRNLGIDPEWNGLPIATYNQKLESIRHYQNISTKKYPKYEQIRRKLLEEVSRRISLSQKLPKKFDVEKKSFLNKAMKNVKSKALKALHDLKVPKSHDTSTPIISSKSSTPRESQPKRRLSLELLPKKPTQMDIQEIKRQTRLESAARQKKEEPTPKRRPSLNIEEVIEKQMTESVVVEPPRHTELLRRSYQSIEEFMRDIKEEKPKLDMESTKVTSTPSRNSKNILQDTYLSNDSDGQASKQDAAWALASPKNNKSVLKSTNGNPAGSLVKKKVIFDLEKKNSSDKESTATKSIGELAAEQLNEKKELTDSDWNISSISEEREVMNVKENIGSNENIHLKTSQSEKIAQISRQIQEKLEASRRKPAGSIEAMFAAKSYSTANERDETGNNQKSMDIISSVLGNTSSHNEPRPRSKPNLVPRPAPRKQLFATKDSDLDMDVDDLLANS